MRSGGSGSPSSRTAGPRTGSDGIVGSIARAGPGPDRSDGIHSRLTGQSMRGKEPAVRAAAVHLNSTEDKDRNLEAADRLTRAAAADGAELVVLPEKFNVLGTHEDFVRGAETLEGRTIGWAREVAHELGIDLVPGSISERRDGHEKLSNTSVHVGPDGEVKAVYRKIHMFDVEVGGQVYRESESEDPGGEIVMSDTVAGLPLGLTVCYDLRFPELYRILAVRGARIVTLPAAFTKVTGQAHWDILIRARAIENQAFMVAALALARQDDVREKLPSLANRVETAYRWPAEAPV